MKLLTTALKSGLLASTLLFSAIYTQLATGFVTSFILCTLFTTVISLFMLVLTILPFTVYYPNYSKQMLFKACFPRYAIGSFFGYLILLSLFNIAFIEFYFLAAIAYFTGLQAWVWYCKPPKPKNYDALS